MTGCTRLLTSRSSALLTRRMMPSRESEGGAPGGFTREVAQVRAHKRARGREGWAM
eukprot:CAMPEP_0204049372 /NCGR_PEP_ID=MMETSP0360-20130528/118107_1 /ASSEMBLY_ACC=CAM_ASM_000342 /TAXON_ID=268821 /ORGANISM="Scrippsiella Hangoei, Strain SHTV-5" /LENGTH=55 /DNA_ID=CAMNT_0050996253 /DNA_START=64 /DNA_END=231 /DNA_ORIENTATION=+